MNRREHAEPHPLLKTLLAGIRNRGYSVKFTGENRA